MRIAVSVDYMKTASRLVDRAPSCSPARHAGKCAGRFGLEPGSTPPDWSLIGPMGRGCVPRRESPRDRSGGDLLSPGARERLKCGCGAFATVTMGPIRDALAWASPRRVASPLLGHDIRSAAPSVEGAGDPP